MKKEIKNNTKILKVEKAVNAVCRTHFSNVYIVRVFVYIHTIIWGHFGNEVGYVQEQKVGSKLYKICDVGN